MKVKISDGLKEIVATWLSDELGDVSVVDDDIRMGDYVLDWKKDPIKEVVAIVGMALTESEIDEADVEITQ